MFKLALVFIAAITIIIGEVQGFKEVKYRCNSNCVPKKFFIGDDPTSWEEASTLCKTKGMVLASVENEKEFQFIKAYLLIEAHADRTPLAWLGATDRGQLNKGLYWIKNKRPLTTTFSKLSSSPSGNIYESCLYQSPGSEWTATYCTPDHLPGHARALCERA